MSPHWSIKFTHMKSYLSGCFLLSLSLLFSITNIKAQISQDEFESLVQDFEYVGILAAYITAEDVTFYESGVTKLGEETELKNYHQMHLGSNTKAFTARLVSFLVEEDLINWDTKLSDIIPDSWLRRPYYNEITLQMLLDHKSGVPSLTSGLYIAALPKFKGSPRACRAQYVRYMLQRKPDYMPGETYNYSNAGYGIATFMVEEAGGLEWDDLLGQYLKGETYNYCLGFPNECDINQPWGHWDQTGVLMALGPDHFYKLPEFLFPAGGLSLPFLSYADWIQNELISLTDPNDTKHEMVDWLHYHDDEYSTGWGTGADRTTGHDGSAGTFYVSTHIDPLKGYATIVASNSATAADVDLLYYIKSVLEE